MFLSLETFCEEGGGRIVNVGREKGENQKGEEMEGGEEGRKAGRVAHPNHNGVSIQKRQSLRA